MRRTSGVKAAGVLEENCTHRPVQYLNNVLEQDHRDAVAAERFLTKALGGENHLAPRVINTDKHAAYPPAHDRRLRSDSHDPQRPGVRECGGCEGRSIARNNGYRFAKIGKVAPQAIE